MIVPSYLHISCLLRSVRGMYLTLRMNFSSIFPFFLLISTNFWMSWTPPTGMIMVPSYSSCQTKAQGIISADAPTWITSNFIYLSRAHPILPSPVSILILGSRSGLPFQMFQIDFLTSQGTCSIPYTIDYGGTMRAIAAVRYPVPLPTSRTLRAVSSLEWRSSRAQACMWVAEIVAPQPMV